MLEEIRKSINSNLYQRTKSPLYGTIIISWCLWNWKFFYYLLIVDSKTPFLERMDFIKTNVVTDWTLFYGPGISTIAILTVFEFIANYTYWLHIYSKTWRMNKKVKTEGKQLLSYEQSLKLRNDLRQTGEEYEKLIQEKETKIRDLENYIKTTETPEKTPIELTNNDVKIKKTDLLYKKLKDEHKLAEFKNVCSYILNKKSLLSTDPIIMEFVTIGLIIKDRFSIDQNYYYTLSKEGKELHDMLLFN